MYNESTAIFHPLKDFCSNLNSDHLAQNNPRWDSDIFHTRCVAACSEEKRCSWPNMSLYSNTHSILVLGALALYPIASLIGADYILSVYSGS